MRSATVGPVTVEEVIRPADQRCLGDLGGVESPATVSPEWAPADNQHGMIQLENVTKRYTTHGGVVALDEVSLTIPTGQLISIVGPSGSGKSTLLHLIGALDRPTTGTVRIDGESLGELSDDTLTLTRRDKIGFIFQFFHLLPALTCLENVGLPLHLARWPKRKVADRARELLALVQLEHRMNHVPEALSGGQRQRVAIARALAASPRILLGDEPTGNLDTRTGQEILALLHDLHSQLGSTVVIVTHDPDVARTCSRTVSMRDGRIVEDSAA